MNIYLISDDGECYCVKAETAQGAIDAATERFLHSLSDEELNGEWEQEHGESPAAWWNSTCFESCQIIGELVND